MVAVASRRRPELAMDRGLPGKPGLRLGDPPGVSKLARRDRRGRGAGRRVGKLPRPTFAAI